MPSTTHLEKLIPFAEALATYGVSEAQLDALIQTGALRGAMLPNGEIYVSAQINASALLNLKLQQIQRSQFDHLANSQVSVSQAIARYGIPRRTIRGWVKNNYVHSSNDSVIMLNEADLAYCAAIYAERKKAGMPFGAPLLDDSGNPYLIRKNQPLDAPVKRRE